MRTSTNALSTLMLRIVSDNDLHARWLNTLSYLEYIGFRKIIKSQDAGDMTQQTLQHANEEGRHALLLKNICLKVGGPRYDSYHPSKLLKGFEAEFYFQSIDSGVEALLSSVASGKALSRLTYLAVTWLVEVRALKVYGAYTEALRAHGLSSPLASLLKEEERHLEDVQNEIKNLIPERLRSDLEALENVRYQEYLRQLTLELGANLEVEIAPNH